MCDTDLYRNRCDCSMKIEKIPLKPFPKKVEIVDLTGEIGQELAREKSCTNNLDTCQHVKSIFKLMTSPMVKNQFSKVSQATLATEEPSENNERVLSGDNHCHDTISEEDSHKFCKGQFSTA